MIFAGNDHEGPTAEDCKKFISEACKGQVREEKAPTIQPKIKGIHEIDCTKSTICKYLVYNDNLTVYWLYL